MDKPFLGELVQGISYAPASAHLSNDERTIYFDSSDGIVFAKRASRKDAFGPSQRLANVPSGVCVVRLSSDEKTIYYVMPVTGGPDQIYSAKRDNADAEFPPGTPLPDNINKVTGFSVGDPFAQGNEFWFTARMGADSDSDKRLFRATFSAAGEFNDPQEVTELNAGEGIEDRPVLTADGLAVYFGSARKFPGSDPNYIFTAKRTRTDEAFGTPTEVRISHKTHDIRYRRLYWVSPDGCRLYMGHPGRTGWTFLSVASRPE